MKEKRDHILIIDDDEVDVKNLLRAFKANNMALPVQIASNGRKALDMLQAASAVNAVDMLPVIIILDLKMPQMDGLEFLQALRNDLHLRAINVYILSGSDNARDKIDAYNLNVAGYILKPSGFQELTKTIKLLKEYWELIEMPILS